MTPIASELCHLNAGGGAAPYPALQIIQSTRGAVTPLSQIGDFACSARKLSSVQSPLLRLSCHKIENSFRTHEPSHRSRSGKSCLRSERGSGKKFTGRAARLPDDAVVDEQIASR
jgi:hypothetical protein